MLENLKKTSDNFANVLVAVPAILDMLFIYIFGMMFDFSRNNVAARLGDIIDLLNANNVQITPSEATYSSLISTLKQVQGFDALYNSILLNVAVFLAILFILWILFESFSWWFCYKLNKIKLDADDFIKRFIIKSLGYYAVFCISILISVRLAVSRLLSVSVESGEAVYSWFYYFLILLLILSAISYSNISGKLLKILSSYTTIKALLISAALYAVGDRILYLAGLQSPELAMALGFVFFMPLLAYIRMFMINVTHSKGA